MFDVENRTLVKRLPQQERSQARFEAVLKAALRLFAARGYENTSMREIAREARMDSVLKFARVFALGTWVGSIIYFVAIVTRGADGAVLTQADSVGLGEEIEARLAHGRVRARVTVKSNE